VSELHLAFAEQRAITLPRLTELLEFLEAQLSPADYQTARDLLWAVADPMVSARLHREAGSAPPPAPEPEPEPQAAAATAAPTEQPRQRRRRAHEGNT
jgi:hypothetical protein